MKWEHSISRLKLEQFVLGELPAREARDVEVKIKEDARLLSEYEEILASNQAILDTYPVEDMVKAIEKRFKEETSGSRGLGEMPFSRIARQAIPYIGGLALAAMALFVVGPVYFSQAPALNDEEEVVFAKGAESRMVLYLKEDGDSRVVRAGEELKQGDRLRIAYFSGEAPYGVLFSIDGRGTLTLHYPDRAGDLPLIHTGEETLLDYSYELDDAPEFEKFYFVTSANAFDPALVLEKAEEVSQNNRQGLPGSLDLGREFNEYSVYIQKEGQ